jgi:hypothetical protein
MQFRMVKKCIYCLIPVEENSVVDICRGCMHKVWGPKMSTAIVSSMESEKEKGNLELGRVSESQIKASEQMKKIPVPSVEKLN